MPPDQTRLQDLQHAMESLDPAGVPSAILLRRAPAGTGRAATHVGVLDASYNPMTVAHARLADAARRTVGLDETLFLLSRANVDKEVFGARLGQRLHMLLRFAAGDVTHSVGGCSHARFVDKATALRGLYPSGTRFTFILGFDTLQRLFDPKYYADMNEELGRFFDSWGVAAANRGDLDLASMQAWMKRPEVAPFASRVVLFEVEKEVAAMSSTEVRNRCAAGASIARLVPPAVAEVIHDLGLYR